MVKSLALLAAVLVPAAVIGYGAYYLVSQAKAAQDARMRSIDSVSSSSSTAPVKPAPPSKLSQGLLAASSLVAVLGANSGALGLDRLF
jgi:hypothetical protein